MRKYSADKLRMVKAYFGKLNIGITSVSTGEGIHPTTLEEWIRNYQSMGSETLQQRMDQKNFRRERDCCTKYHFSGLVHYVIL